MPAEEKIQFSSVGPAAKDLSANAMTRQGAGKTFDLFNAEWRAKFPGTVECLQKDRDALLALHKFPAEHWSHLRTTNPIKSLFTAVRRRYPRTKGSGTRAHACCEEKVAKTQPPPLFAKIIRSYNCVDEIMQEKDAA